MKMKIAVETFFIDASDSGITLHIRNKHRFGAHAFPANKVILFVHGATYPSETIFDIDLPGGSWMDFAVRRGYDTYLLDIRGYGRSTRPPSMGEPPDKNVAFATTADAIRDVDVTVDFILKRRSINKINLVGWSWGTTILGGFTAMHNEKVAKLALYAPLWILREPPPFSGTGAYRSVPKKEARERSLRGIPDSRKQEISPQAWFDKWWDANMAADPVGAGQIPQVVRAPNGVLKDTAELLAKGRTLYDPSHIRVPTLIISAEWDQDTPLFMAQEVFGRLVNSPHKRQVVISEGTHTVALEKNRMELIEEVQHFLDDNSKFTIQSPSIRPSKSKKREGGNKQD
jgi:pimeloyl-ACP methyl ester carboxylesterase